MKESKFDIEIETNGTRKKRGGGPEEEEKLKLMVVDLGCSVEGMVPLLGMNLAPPILVLI